VSQTNGEADWPAVILSEEEVAALGLEIPDGQDVAVKFYGPEISYGYAAYYDVSPFEGSSEKAVTILPDLREAIKMAMSDETANPLKIIATSGAAAAASTGKQPRSSAAQGDGRSSKKLRTEGGATSQGASSSSPHEDSLPERRLPATYQYTDVSTLLDIASKLQTANETSDVRAAMKQLLRLDRIAVTYEQLRTTKVGIAIGNLLDNSALRGVWPLADHLARTLMTIALPQATLAALQFQRNEARFKDAGVEQARQTVAAAAARSGAVERIVTAFSTFEDDAIKARGSDFDLTEFAKQIFQALPTPDSRTLFLTEITKSAHSALRRQFLNGEMTAAKFATLTPSDLTTTEEMELEAKRNRERIEAEDREKAADSIGTEMFPCPNCGKRNARYHEQQTRGADEPTTKFCKCLECNHNWTTE